MLSEQGSDLMEEVVLGAQLIAVYQRHVRRKVAGARGRGPGSCGVGGSVLGRGQAGSHAGRHWCLEWEFTYGGGGRSCQHPCLGVEIQEVALSFQFLGISWVRGTTEKRTNESYSDGCLALL